MIIYFHKFIQFTSKMILSIKLMHFSILLLLNVQIIMDLFNKVSRRIHLMDKIHEIYMVLSFKIIRRIP